MPSKIAKLLLDKDDLLSHADDQLLDSLKATERHIFKTIRNTLSGMSIEGGNFNPDQAIAGFQKDLLKAFNESPLPKDVSKWLVNFDTVEELNKKATGALHKVDLSGFNVSKEKKALIDELTEQLSVPKGIKTNIVKPLTTILNRHVLLGSSVKEAEAALRTFILSSPDKNSHLTRYVKQISMDSINQYDGAINQKLATELDMDHFFYVGSLIKTSRGTCRGMLGQGTLFSDLWIKPGLFPITAIPEIIRRSRGMPGFNPLTTPSTFFTYRMGFNCRHMTQPVILNEFTLPIVDEVNKPSVTSAVKATKESTETARRAKNALASHLSKYKKAILGGKQPTAGQIKAFDSATDAQRAKINQALKKAVPAKTPGQILAEKKLKAAENRLRIEAQARVLAAEKVNIEIALGPVKTGGEINMRAFNKLSPAAQKSTVARASKIRAEIKRKAAAAKKASTKKAGNDTFDDFEIKEFRADNPKWAADLENAADIPAQVKSTGIELNELVGSINKGTKARKPPASFKGVRQSPAPKFGDPKYRAYRLDEITDFESWRRLEMEKYTSLQKKYKTLQKQEEAFGKVFRENLVRGRDAGDISLSTTDKFSREVKGAATVAKKQDKALNWLQKFVGKGKVDGMKMDVTPSRGRRAYFRENRFKQEGQSIGEIAINGSTKPQVFIHEMSHGMEYYNQNLFEKVVDFLERRNIGESPRSLKSLTGKNFGPGEMSMPDDFIEPYMGKLYRGGRYKGRTATEILSVGVEKMYKNPARLFAEDEEMFNFIWSLFQ